MPLEPNPDAEAPLLPAVLRPDPATRPPLVPTRPVVLKAAPEVSDLIQALSRRWRLALFAGSFAAVTVGLAVWQVVPAAKYSAKTMLHVATFRPKVLFDTADQQTEARAYQRTQMTLARSRLVLDAAVHNPEVEKLPMIRAEADPAEWLEKELRVDFPNGSEIMVISLSGDRPEDLPILVNAVADSYLQAVHEIEHRPRSERSEKLKKLYGSYQSELESKRKDLRTLAEVAGADDRETLAVKQQLALEELAIMRQELLKVRGEYREAESQVHVLATRERVELSNAVPDATVEWFVEQDPQVRDIKASQVDVAARLADAKRLTRSQLDPSVRALTSRRDSLKAALAARVQAIRPKIREDLIEKAKAEQGSELAQAQTRLDVLRKHEAKLVEEIERKNGEGRDLSRNVLDLKSSADEVKIIDDVARKVGAESEALDVELQAAPRIVPLHRAETPKTKDELKRVKVAIGSAVLTFIASLVGIAIWEFRERKISSLEVVVNGLGLRLVGALPLVPTRGRGKRSAEEAARRTAPLVESVDAARTVLLHASRTGENRVVMITSAVKGEGKTSLAVHLAMSLARAGRRTLLVDCDLRGSAIHRLFDAEQTPGICEVIRGEMPADGAIEPTQSPGLWILPAGTRDASTLQAIARDGLRAIFADLRSRFDFVIVDSAPILPVADSLLIGQQVDAVLFAIFRDVSRVPDVHAACQRLEALGVLMLGAVVAGATDDPASYSYKAPYAYAGGP